MKRDMRVVRAILEWAETLSGTVSVADTDPATTRRNMSYDVVRYHILLCIDAGLLLGDISDTQAPTVSMLTWQGHDVLEQLKNGSYSSC